MGRSKPGKTKRLPGKTRQAFVLRRNIRTGAWEEDPGAEHHDYCHAELGGGGVRRGVETNMVQFMLHCNRNFQISLSVDKFS
ncbi:MAG: hypothetical protein ABJN75_10700 [Hoeflea sp.]|uniref:hypothetical protein n=1 Tax=Hoeflea sp. TaxID=1940281 RepID=UPI00329754D5